MSVAEYPCGTGIHCRSHKPNGPPSSALLAQTYPHLLACYRVWSVRRRRPTVWHGGPTRPPPFRPNILVGKRVPEFDPNSRSQNPPDLALHTAPARVARRRFLAMLGTGALLLTARQATAAQKGQADTSDEIRAEATRQLPLAELTREGRAKIQSVLDHTSLFRRLPEQTVDCDGEMHLFLVRHPEVVVNTWRVMGITGVSVKRIDEFLLDANDGGGTTSRIELMYGTPELNLYYCDGLYEGPLFKRKMQGKAVLVARHKYGRNGEKRPVVVSGMDVFLQIEHFGAELVAKAIQGGVGKTVDGNFAESCKFAGRLSRAAEDRGEQMQGLADKLDQCSPDVRKEFVRISKRIGQESVAALDEVRPLNRERALKR